jgi:hypothetical protein
MRGEEMLKRIDAFCEWIDNWPWTGLLLSVLFLTALFWTDSSEHYTVEQLQSAVYAQKASSDVFAMQSRSDGIGNFKLSDWLLVLFNGFLALFTYRLFVSTERLFGATKESAYAAKTAADAAAAQAAAAIDVEKPHLFIERIELIAVDTDAGHDHERFILRFVFHNYGRTPAFVEHIGWGSSISHIPPTIPDYRLVTGLTVEIVVRPTFVHTFEPPNRQIFRVAHDERREINAEDKFIWIWGSIGYRDFFGGRRDFGFIAFQTEEIITGAGRDAAIGLKSVFRLSDIDGYTYDRYTPKNV